MITAVDSSVVLDVLINDRQFGAGSEAALRKAGNEGKLVVCECVIAEVFPALGNQTDFTEFLTDWQLTFSAIDIKSAILAGEYFESYLSRGGNAKRVVPDFLIGAHALLMADRLLARDRGYLNDYFNSLNVWDPSIE
ncbi:MAG: type II toxin-antitoxin system VapC family toxin [Spirochaetales bacterium]|jgi:predicted nucleic acid-binding protein|nr:type II toxin-antitoxin system VapC family toxin [Spirochaetales bacterium]